MSGSAPHRSPDLRSEIAKDRIEDAPDPSHPVTSRGDEDDDPRYSFSFLRVGVLRSRGGASDVNCVDDSAF